MIDVKISCPQLDDEFNFELFSEFDYNVLHEVILRFEAAALCTHDYVEMFSPRNLNKEV